MHHIAKSSGDTRLRRHPIAVLALLAATLACNTLLPRPAATPRPPTATVVDEQPTRALARQPIATATVEATNSPELAGGVRACDFVPGESVAAVMPPEVGHEPPVTRLSPGALPSNTPVDADVTAAQLDLYHALVNDVENEYVYPDYNGVNWPALKASYEALIAGGLTDDDFYLVLKLLLYDLGDDHSYFQSPQEVKEADAEFAGNNDYVGIGVFVRAIPEVKRAVILYTFPGGAAEAAGLRSHDSILAVNGEPILDETGAIRNSLLGEPGTEVVVTIAHPGGEPIDLTLTRRRITGATQVDYCLMAEAHIGYIFLPHLDDETIPDQVRAALDAMTLEYPLAGLIIDNRQNTGGRGTVLYDVLALFTSGMQGTFVSRKERHLFVIDPEDRGGSQTVPLVVLVAPETMSFGEVMSGVLHDSGRATVIGQTSQGNVETIMIFNYPNGSRAWIAHDTFQYPSEEPGLWEDTGIIPDIEAPSRWDLFTEATDPALAAAVAVFGK